jgi:uncharacterized membrane protein YhdT
VIANGMPRWVKVFCFLLGLLVIMVAIMVLVGAREPAAHRGA